MTVFRSRRPRNPALPPGQHEEARFPVLSMAPSPWIRQSDRRLTSTSESGERPEWTWDGLLALGRERIETDLHRVTRWPKVGTAWRGLPSDRLLEGTTTEAGFVMARCYGG